MQGDPSIDIGLTFPTRNQNASRIVAGRVGCAQTELRAGTLARQVVIVDVVRLGSYGLAPTLALEALDRHAVPPWISRIKMMDSELDLAADVFDGQEAAGATGYGTNKGLIDVVVPVILARTIDTDHDVVGQQKSSESGPIARTGDEGTGPS